jgi:ABC-type multidrug transport system fused ATPase/permease subunit
VKLPLPYSRRFFRDHVVGLWRWYLPGTLAVGLTAWLGVQVPVTMAHGLDLLRSGEAGVLKDALLIAAIGVAVMVVRTLSRVWFFTPGREAECAVRERFFAHLLRLQPDFYARYPTGDLLSRACRAPTPSAPWSWAPGRCWRSRRCSPSASPFLAPSPTRWWPGPRPS